MYSVEMKRVEGSAGVRLLECTNPVKNKWRVRWDVKEREDGSASYMESEFNGRPSAESVRKMIMDWCNSVTSNRILSGFEYGGHLVWLSGENQQNYKSAYDLAVRTNGDNLPVTFKFGDDDNPYYQEFTDITGLEDFYIRMARHIQNALYAGWKMKDSLDMDLYRL